MKLCMYVCVHVRKTKRNIFLSFFSFRQFTCIFSLSLSLSLSLSFFLFHYFSIIFFRVSISTFYYFFSITLTEATTMTACTA